MASDKFTLILGSQSPRRKELLSWLKIPFCIVTADLDEISHESEPHQIAMDLASQKARAVKEKLQGQARPFIMASDTIVVLDGKLYAKPADVDEARAILSELSGRTHEVITGVSFLYEEGPGQWREHLFFDSTAVTFNVITPHLMQAYLETRDSLDKAGAYGIQGPSLTFISKVNGSYSNVVGFPLNKIVEELAGMFGENWSKKF